MPHRPALQLDATSSYYDLAKENPIATRVIGVLVLHVSKYLHTGPPSWFLLKELALTG
jgi:hypothetical protein